MNFPSGDGSCAGWWTTPPGPAPWPAVVLVHGLGATRDMALPRYEQAFSAAGIAVLSFDYRHLGASPGQPRQLISIPRQLDDVAAALSYVRARNDVAASRVGLWGTSFGAAHVLTTGARDHELAAAVVQCPVIDGFDAARTLGLASAVSLSFPILRDLVSRLLRATRPTIGIVGDPGERALVTVPGAAQGWKSLMPVGYEFDNRLMPSLALQLLRYRPARKASNIACPLLVVVSERETLTSPQIATRAAESAPSGRALLVDADHFEVYHPPLVDRLIAEQVEFLRTHLIDS